MKFHTRVTLVTLLLATVVTAALIAVSEWSVIMTTRRIAQAITPANQLLWQQALTHQYEQMAKGIPDLERDFYVRQALKAQDRTALTTAGATFFNLVREQGYFQQMHISNSAGEILYSAPDDGANPRSSPMLTDNTLLQKALKDLAPHNGIQRNAEGRLVAVSAFPLKIRQELIGAGVFTQTLDAALTRFKASDAVDVFIVAVDGTVEYGTNTELYAQLSLRLPMLGEATLERIRCPAGGFLVTVQPLHDGHGAPVAHLVSVRDHSAALDWEWTFAWSAYSAVTLLTIIMLAGLYRFMSRTLRPVQDILAALQAIAAGRLDQSWPTSDIRHDEISQIQRATAEMNQNLRALLGDIQQASQRLGGNAQQIFKIAGQTHHALEQQNNATEQVSSAATQLAASIHEIAQHTEAMSAETKIVYQQASASMDLVNASREAVSQLSVDVEKSARIVAELAREITMVDGILRLIQDVAGQTDRLALNAALEAARAADHGRGFSVIADEVRNLAKRTQQSTQEIQSSLKTLLLSAEHATAMMNHGSNQARQSVGHVRDAAIAFQTITEATTRMMSVTEQIASAIEQQSTAAAEISHSTAHIIAIASHGEESAEQTATAGNELLELAETLRARVHRFTL